MQFEFIKNSRWNTVAVKRQTCLSNLARVTTCSMLHRHQLKRGEVPLQCCVIQGVVATSHSHFSVGIVSSGACLVIMSRCIGDCIKAPPQESMYPITHHISVNKISMVMPNHPNITFPILTDLGLIKLTWLYQQRWAGIDDMTGNVVLWWCLHWQSLVSCVVVMVMTDSSSSRQGYWVPGPNLQDTTIHCFWLSHTGCPTSHVCLCVCVCFESMWACVCVPAFLLVCVCLSVCLQRYLYQAFAY